MFRLHYIVFMVQLVVTAAYTSSKYTLLSHLAKQSQALAHGIELANRYGDIGGNGRYRQVAFVAYTSSNSAYSSSSQVKFRNVVTNVGGSFFYDYFRAPYDGLYVFEWSIRPYSGTHNYPAIYVNGSRKMYSMCTSYSSYYNTCSKSVPLMLRKGDQVSIRSYSGTLYVASAFSSFSGWML